MQANSIIPSDLHIDIIEGKPMVSSLTVAEKFEKEHRRVVQDVRTKLNLWGAEDVHGSVHISDTLESSFCRANFIPTTYEDTYGRNQTSYNMTKDGFALLVMGYTGEMAERFKIAYINAFNRLQEENDAQRKRILELEVEKARLETKKADYDRIGVSKAAIEQDPVSAAWRALMTVERLYDCLKKRSDHKDLYAAYEAIGRVLDRHEPRRVRQSQT